MLRNIFMFPDSYDLVLMIVGVLGAIADGITLPFLFLFYAKLLNTIASTAPHTSVSTFFSQHIKENALILCFIGCGQWLACFLEGYCWTKTSERQASRLGIKYMKAVMRQDVAYFDLNITSSAQVVASVSSDTLVIQDVISEKVPVFLMNLSTFVSGYVVSFILLWRLAVVSIPFVLLLVVPGLIHGRTLTRIARKMRSAHNKADTIVEQAISSVRTVYSFVAEMKIITNYSIALEAAVRLGLKQGLVKGLAIGSSGVIFAIWAFITYYGARLVIYNGAKGGDVYIAGASMMIGGLAFGSCLPNIKYFTEARAAGERIMEVIRRVPAIDSNNVEGLVLENVLGEIEFNHVKFSYPARPDSMIFEDFNTRIPPGETVALVGGSGSGKSTVIALLQRFYDPDGGEVLFDGVPIHKLHLKWLRSQMGLVSQEPVLFATTIKENILFGKEDASMEEVLEAAKASNAHSFISRLPEGYDTQVGERGVQLSGGQKQRIAIARAIIKVPKILLLDEATSALDSESERIVQEALDQAAVGRTTIVIAHRLSTIRSADTIIVLEHGQVKETGSHDELMSDRNGLYASLVHLQENDNDNRELADVDANISYDVCGTSCQRMSSMSRCSSASSDALSKSTRLAVVSKDQVSVVPSFRRLLMMNRPEWKQATLGCISAVLFGAVQPVYAFTMGSLIAVYFSTDLYEVKRESDRCSLIFLGMSVFCLLISICQHYNFAVMGENLTKRIREKMLRKLLTFEIGWFDQDDNAIGAICSTLARDAEAVRSLVGDRMSILIQASSAAVIACTMGLAIAWKLALVMISAQPFIILCFYCKKTVLQNVSAKSIESQKESSKIAVEVVTNLRNITSFSSQDRIIQLLEKAHEIQRRESVHLSWFAGLLLGTSQSLATFSWGLSFWYGGKLIALGDIGAKELFQTILILASTGRVIGEAGSMTSDIAAGASAVESVFAVLGRISSIDPEDSDGFKPQKLTGHIKLQNVDFAYPARPSTLIFQGFSIDIEAGKSTALVGQSGSGKSTIVGLIERFYDPIKGTVKIDGRDIKSYHLRSLRRHIALVSQEPTLFAMAIRENISYGGEQDIAETEVIEAAKAANAHEFIVGLEDGYDTFCGDRGLQLSGGQKQRIVIARAILRNPAILLLDEATSALDNHSERAVQDALERVIVGRTSVVVAHRLSTIRHCDMIAVLEQGKVIEKGTHSSLLANGGVYSSLVSLQTISHVDAQSQAT